MGLYFATALILVLFAAPVVICSRQNQPGIKEWCAKTYNPEPCEDLLAADPKYAAHPIVGKEEFIQVSLQLAYDRAVNASKSARLLGPKCRNQSEKAAWAECVDLYDKNVAILKQTTHHVYICGQAPPAAGDAQPELNGLNLENGGDPHNEKCTAFDVLKASLENIDDCEDRFLDIDMTDNVMPAIRDGVLEDLIVNALALVSGAE